MTLKSLPNDPGISTGMLSKTDNFSVIYQLTPDKKVLTGTMGDDRVMASTELGISA